MRIDMRIVEGQVGKYIKKEVSLLLNLSPKLLEVEREIAQRIAEQMEERTREDIESWAEDLADEISKAGD